MTQARSPRPPEIAQQFLQEMRAATQLLQRVLKDRSLLLLADPEERRRFDEAIANVFQPDARARRAMVKATARERKRAAARRDDERLHETGIRVLRRRPVFTTPNVYLLGDPGAGTSSVAPGERDDRDVQPRADAPSSAPETVVPQHCYICKQKFVKVHHFYDQMCEPCAEFNYRKRTELVDLSGRTALLTGGRVKIGYQAGLKLLRCGARLLVTTRFPRDSAMRYAEEPDFEDWKDRLEIFGLDLRHTPSVETFCAQLLQSEARLDFIVNNACQTVRRPPAFYAHMMQREHESASALPASARRLLQRYEELRTPSPAESTSLRTLATGETGTMEALGLTQAAALSQLPLLPEDHDASAQLFPAGQFDQDLQQIDRRSRNSWRLLLDEVPSVELLEVQLVNAVAPFLLNARLKPLMLRTDNRDKHIVNVSAMEGQFYRNNKTTRHPHTNMAKAALNMMTRTSAADYQQDGIHMNSVDTGWITDEDVVEIAQRKVENHRFHPPLDIVDGAARIVDPIIDGVATGHHQWGQFLKDYAPTDW
jgi:NAD(P)-dependent dehydrogenase (short-subunit alcohol dehydrogenase family)